MRLSRFGILFMCVVWSALAGAQATQTFSNGATGTITDDQAWNLFPLQINSLNSPTLNGNWGLDKVTLNITHTWDADLEVWLKAPDGTEVMLFNGIGGDGDDFTNTALKNTYTNIIADFGAPFNGSFKPTGDLGLFNNGHSGVGTWYLKIRDNNAQDIGALGLWSIRFSNSPAEQYTPVSSNLPIIHITTDGGKLVPDDPKIKADFKIIYHGPGVRNYANDSVFNYEGNIGIEQRGSSSAWPSKKSYGFETWDGVNYPIDTPLLGMPAENDWILSASYWDKTLMRNVLSYNLANQMGHYASRTQYCEVFVNNTYMGVYMLMEKIKRNPNRVDVAKLSENDTAGVNISGGYILKIDKFTGSGGDGFYSNYPPSNPTGDAIFYQYEYPNQDDINATQKAYIQGYVDSFETALFGPGFQDANTGFRQYAAEKDFLDYMLLNEMSKNVDGYRLSTYLYKEKTGKLHAGPAWDFDIAWQNANYCQAEVDTGWAYNLNYVCTGAAVPAWWERMRQDTLFNQHLYCRWAYLRSNILHTDTLNAYIDGVADLLSESQQRNFKAWPILGVATWPQPNPIPQSYDEETQRLKSWINTRLNWLDQQIYSLAHNPLPVALGNDTTVCQGNPVRLYAGDYSSYQWSNGDDQPIVYAGQTGDYAVTASDKFQCYGYDDINITVNPNPVVNLGPDTSYCAGSAIQFNATNGIAYEWNTGATTSNITVNQPGTYGVEVTAANGCTASDFVNVYELSLPDATIQANPLFATTYQFNTTGPNLASVWYFGNGDSSLLNNPTYSFPSTGTYQITHAVTDINGCSAADTLYLNVVPNGLNSIFANTTTVYPNPATDKLIVTCNQPAQQIRVTDVTGRVYFTTSNTLNTTTIDVSTLACGVYVIEIKTNSNTAVKRFIKQ